MSTQLPSRNSPENSPSPITPGVPAAPAESQVSESPLAQFKSVRLSQNNLISLGIGVIIGLLLGLLVGWVWWPVEWQGAGLSELNSPARAAYLAAVADAYAQSEEPAALDAARERLTTLGADLPAQFDDAIRYYADTEPPDRTTITNLVALAMALQLQLESVLAQDAQAATGAVEQTAGSPPATAPAIGAATGAVETTAPSGAASTGANAGGSRWNWLWVILLGAVLVGGGIFVLRYVAGRGLTHPQTAPADAPDAGSKSTPSGGQAGSPSRSSSQAGVASGAMQAGRTPPSAGYGGASGLQATIPPSAANAAVVGGANVSVLSPAPRNGQNRELGFTDDDLDGEEGEASTASSAPTALAAGPADVRPAPTDTAGGTVAGVTPAWVTAPGRGDRYPALHSCTATFQVGQENFDFAKNIPNPAGAGYLGEYGMVIPERFGTVGNNLEQVVAIEVNLFDKTDEAEIKTVTRFLLSEYAMDHLYDQFARERRGVDPISAQPGTRFLLEGRQLLLDCLIREATFTPEHYFKRLTVEMTARRKTPS